MSNEKVTVTKESLYEDFRRDANKVGFLLIAAWLWTVFSFFTSTNSGTWFARSGSVLCLIGAIATFWLVNNYARALTIAVEHGITLARRVELMANPPKLYQSVQYFAYMTGIVGTVIWGYGDILVRLVYPEASAP
jgi:hypothetical protein